MGTIISVWSSARSAGKSVFLYALAKQLSGLLDKELKILLCCMNLSYGSLAKLLGIDKNELNLEDIVNFKVHPDHKLFDLVSAIARYDNNLYFTGSKNTSPAYAARHIKLYENVLEELRQNFDLVLIDTMSWRENALTNMVLEKSDYVLNIITQDKEALDSHPFITPRDAAYIVNMYRDIYPDSKELASIYGLDNMFTLPCCDELQDMKNKGKLGLYVQHNTGYNSAVNDISCFLTQKLDLPLGKAVVPGKKRKGLFSKVWGHTAAHGSSLLRNVPGSEGLK
jgi:cellulose biosynthesis protein BcsQ